MPYMTEIIIILISYLLGAIPFALIVGKLGYKVDVREHGSGNLGTTNTFRVLGKKAGTLVLLGDMGKGLVAALLPVIRIRCLPSSKAENRWRRVRAFCSRRSHGFSSSSSGRSS